jgi:acetyl esterase/lipase
MKAGSKSAAQFLRVLAALAAGWSLLAASGTARSADTKKPYEMKAVENITYFQGKDVDKAKHQLDLYLPKGLKEFPVLVFIHGGGWRIGDKGNFGVYQAIGKVFTAHGIAVVVPNYRLSPKDKHPAHIRDVARAVAWTVKNIKKYGGRPDQLFLSGQSAGGHLAALLGTDESYLKAEGLSLKAIKGVIPISGVYRLPDKPVLDRVFGKDLAVRKKASPINQVREGLPPFLILYADDDLPMCGKTASTAFCKALRAKKVEAGVAEVKDCNHIMILVKTAADNSAVTKPMLAFIRKHLGTTKKS